MGKLQHNYIAVVALILGLTTIGYAYAQNGTDTTTTETLGGQAAITMTSIIAIILAGLGIVKTLVDKGILDKRIGTAAVIGADTAVAALDTRQLVSEVVNGIVDTLKVDNPEAAAKIQNAVQPVLKRIDDKVKEYQPKVDKFGQIANAIGARGEKTVDAIKEDEELKDNIPNQIVST